MNSLSVLFLIITQVIIGCNQPTKNLVNNHYEIPYSTKEPSKKYKLPKELNEISGLAFIDDNTLASVQDEKGEIFLFDLKEEEILAELKFAKGNDYEGIAFHKNKISVVTSSGILHTMTLKNNELKNIKQSNISQNSTANLEGICYHPSSKSYLLAYKGKTAFDNLHERSIYQYPFANKINKPFITIGNQQIKDYINQVDNPSKRMEKLKKNLVFAKASILPSGIAVHPTTKNIYIISSVNELLVVLDAKTHQIINISFFDNEKNPQPEGIAFNNKGDMFIATEKNKNKSAYIYKFKAQ